MASPITTEARHKGELLAPLRGLEVVNHVTMPVDEQLSGSQYEDRPTDSHGLSSLSRSAQPEIVWDDDELAAFELGLSLFGLQFTKIAQLVGTKTDAECRDRFVTAQEQSLEQSSQREGGVREEVGSENFVAGFNFADTWVSELLSGMKLSTANRERVTSLADDYNQSRIDLAQLVCGVAEVAGRDVVVNSLGSSSGALPQGFGGVKLTPVGVESLLQRGASLEPLFSASIWPQLEVQGWTRESTARGSDVFYPPDAPSTSGSSPEGIHSMRGVLEHLQLHPMKSGPSPASPDPDQQRAAQHRPRRSPLVQRASQRGRPPQAPAAASPRGFVAVAGGGGKVCENCGTTSTPLWRKDRQANMMMCNACGIYYKNHGRHRPVELAQQPPRVMTSSRAQAGRGAGGEDSLGEAVPVPPLRGVRRRSLSELAEMGSDLSEQSDAEEERRRSLRPRRPRVASVKPEWREGFVGEAQYDSETGSEQSSRLVLDEAEAEELRVELINRLVDGCLTVDLEGAVEGLTSLKRARISDPFTGRSWGVVRVYADPCAAAGPPLGPASVSPPRIPPLGAGAHPMPAPKAPRGVQAQAAPRPPATNRPGQTCANCGTSQTPLWRKDRESGLMMCNACGIYYKTHGVHRPLGTSRFKQYAGPSAAPGRGRRGAGRGRRSTTRRSSVSPSPSKRRAASYALEDELEEEEEEEEEDDALWAAGSDSEAGEGASDADAAELPSLKPGGRGLGPRVTSSGRAVRRPRLHSNLAPAQGAAPEQRQQPAQPSQRGAAAASLLGRGPRSSRSPVAVPLFKPTGPPAAPASRLSEQDAPSSAAAALRHFLQQHQVQVQHSPLPKLSTLSSTSDNSGYSIAAGLGAPRGTSPLLPPPIAITGLARGVTPTLDPSSVHTLGALPHGL